MQVSDTCEVPDTYTIFSKILVIFINGNVFDIFFENLCNKEFS